MRSETVGTELECPKCGTVAVNRDFCSCGEYLSWELTTLPTATLASEPATYRPPAPPVPRPSTLLTLRDPARGEDDAGAAVTVPVVPGTEVTVLATIRNQGEIVDTFDVRVEGLPDTWWTIAPPTVFLNPWGSLGDYEQEVQVRLHPPQSSEAEARSWPLAVVARSRSLGVDVAHVPATLAVLPFQSTVMRVGPERRQGRRHASFDVAVFNHGNSPMEIVVGARDSEARCPVNVTPPRTMVPVGASAAVLVRAAVPRPLFFRRPIDHHIDIAHRATGVESVPTPQRVTFRQKPWLPWWLPPVFALLAAFIAAMLLLRRDAEVPKLKGDTVQEARVVLEKRDLKLGDSSYVTAPPGVPLNTILDQQPAAGDALVKGERVHITLAAAPDTGLVPQISGLTLAQAATKLKAARFGYDAQPADAGNDWVVIRQDPTPGSKHVHGTKVTLAVENRKAAAAALTVTPAPTSTPASTAKPASSAAAKTPTPATPAAAKTGSAAGKTAAARVASKPKAKTPAALPADFVFAGATSGQLYRWASADAKAKRLTAPKYRFESPTKTDAGYAAVHVTDSKRHLVRISPDGATVDPIAEGHFHRPVYSPVRGLLATISTDGKRGPADAGRLCVADPQESVAPTCAPARGRQVGRPSWSPDGRSVLALAAGSKRTYTKLLIHTAFGGDAAQWKTPKTAYGAASILSAVWVGNDRIAVLHANRAGGKAHLRVLARGANGTFAPVKAFPALTGYELAATGHHLALRSSNDDAGEGEIVLLDLKRAQPRLRTLASGANPTWE